MAGVKVSRIIIIITLTTLAINTAGSPFKITTQPNDICCKPGEQAKLTILTSPSATTYQWYFRNQAISNPDYKGQTSECLLISKFLPKQKGVYWCVAEDASGTQTTSRHAKLTAGNLFALLRIIVHGEMLLEVFACQIRAMQGLGTVESMRFHTQGRR